MERVETRLDGTTLVVRIPMRFQRRGGRKRIARLVRVRDNGAGLCQSLFAERLTALGASRKRGSSARGFRGVGRLAGLAYCQELVFRSRALGELEVSELRWDCRKLKASLRSADSGVGLSDLVRDVVSVRRVPAPDNPAHFFEVELKGIVRHRNDRLLKPEAVADYLAQVAPVPFSPEFRLGSDITAALRPYVALGDLDIRISGIAEPVFRPHRDWLEIADDKFDRFTDVEILEIPGIDGGVGAVVWVLHHSYAGAIPAGSLVKGLASVAATSKSGITCSWKSSSQRRGSIPGPWARSMSSRSAL